jgi:hypothetical protein
VRHACKDAIKAACIILQNFNVYFDDRGAAMDIKINVYYAFAQGPVCNPRAHVDVANMCVRAAGEDIYIARDAREPPHVLFDGG